MPRAWLTPDSPAPMEERCRTIRVPDDITFVACVTGALLPLTQSDSWEQYGSMTPEEAADIMSVAFEDFVASECGTGGPCPPVQLPGGKRIWRISPITGNWEYLDEDTGEEYIEPTGNEAPPAPEAREETTSEERKCAAAANAANVLYELHSQVVSDAAAQVDAIQAATNLAAAAVALLGGWISLPALGVIALAEAAFNVFFEVAGALTVNVWDEQFTENLTCILKANATDTNGVVTFDFFQVNKDILSEIWASQEYVILVSQVIYLTYIIGPQGLDLAGTTTAVAGDCATCGTWCFEWTGQYLSNGDWTVAEGYIDGSNIVRWTQYGTPYDGAYRRILLRLSDLDTSQCVITRVFARVYAPSGGSGDKYLYLRATPGINNGNNYVYFSYSIEQWLGSPDNPASVTTSGETDLEIRMTSNNSTGWLISGIRVQGTGVCPWGASNC